MFVCGYMCMYSLTYVLNTLSLILSSSLSLYRSFLFIINKTDFLPSTETTTSTGKGKNKKKSEKSEKKTKRNGGISAGLTDGICGMETPQEETLSGEREREKRQEKGMGIRRREWE